MEIFLSLLRHDVKDLLKQAEEYRARATDVDYKKTAVILKKAVDDIEKKASEILPGLRQVPVEKSETTQSLVPIEKLISQEFIIEFNDIIWEIKVEMSYDQSSKFFYEIGEQLIKEQSVKELKSTRRIEIRLSLVSEFVIYFAGTDKSRLEPILRIVAALGLAETVARNSGAKTQGEVRKNFNVLISNFIPSLS